MAGCGIDSGLSVNCDDLKKTGGVNKKAFIFNVDDVASYTYDADGCIEAINFDAYAGLYEFDSRKNAHSGGYTPVIGGEGGNKYFQHDVQLKLFSSDCLDDQVIEDLLVASVGVILETNNKEFKLYGANNGMDQTGGSQSSGQAAASDISDTLIFQGEEGNLPNRVLKVDYQTTKDYLESLVV